MRVVAPIISNHRLQRFHRWAMLWLAWFAAFLDAAADLAPFTQQARAVAHRWLDRVERVVISVAILRDPRPIRRPPPRKRRFNVCHNRCASMRAIIGSRLRRALRSSDLHTRIILLRERIGDLVGRRLACLPCGMTRLFPVLTRPETHFIASYSAPIATAHAPDSS